MVGTEWGRVRSMRSAAGNAVRQALPGQPVEVTGLRGVPQAGDELMVLPRWVSCQPMCRRRTPSWSCLLLFARGNQERQSICVTMWQVHRASLLRII